MHGHGFLYFLGIKCGIALLALTVFLYLIYTNHDTHQHQTAPLAVTTVDYFKSSTSTKAPIPIIYLTFNDSLNMNETVHVLHENVTGDTIETHEARFAEIIEKSSDEELPKTRQVVSIPVLVVACNTMSLSEHVGQLLKYRPRSETHLFPIIVTEGCAYQRTRNAIRKFENDVTLIKQPEIEWSDNSEDIFDDESKLTGHYKWALSQVFNNYTSAIITEGDLTIASDFFEYFSAMYKLLTVDRSLWCASAWNDNGKAGLIFQKKQELLHRTDFFSGISWMLLRETWRELEPKWPPKYWEDWMRMPTQRLDRSCIRPEIGRTSPSAAFRFRSGYLDNNYKSIQLNSRFIKFTMLNLTYLEKSSYDSDLEQQVSSATEITPDDLRTRNFPPESNSVRVIYNSKSEFEDIARTLGIHEDSEFGVMRGAYRGVVSLAQLGYQIYIAPPKGWANYDTSWDQRKSGSYLNSNPDANPTTNFHY